MQTPSSGDLYTSPQTVRYYPGREGFIECLALATRSLNGNFWNYFFLSMSSSVSLALLLVRVGGDPVHSQPCSPCCRHVRSGRLRQRHPWSRSSCLGLGRLGASESWGGWLIRRWGLRVRMSVLGLAVWRCVRWHVHRSQDLRSHGWGYLWLWGGHVLNGRRG